MITRSIPKPNAPRIVIVGRPNVGKSTLFNRLFGSKRALVLDEPGVTRDRLEEQAEWWVKGKRYLLNVIDTGGLGGDRLGEEIAFQVRTALERADVVVSLYDGQSGYTPADREVTHGMVRSGLRNRSILLVAAVNKVDDPVHSDVVNEFYETGIEDVVGISAEHGRGIETLQELIVERLSESGKLEPEPSAESEVDRVPRVAIVGRPNAGKSTFVNAVIGQERMITSPVAGTTVDAIDTLVEFRGKPMVLIDTAGIRRKSKTEQGVEVLSIIQARKAVERANIAILMLDAERGATEQDEKIAGMIEETGCSVILAVNKWDAVRGKKGVTKDSAADQIRDRFGFLRYAPILFISAKEGRGFRDLAELVYDILVQRRIRIPTNEFTNWVRAESEVHNPHNVRIYLCHQVSRHPPTFVCHVSNPDKVHFSLHRHLVNAIRERWGFAGTPVRLLFVEGKSRTGPRRKLDRSSTGRTMRPPKPDAASAAEASGPGFTVDSDLESDYVRELRSIREQDRGHDREEHS